MSQQAENYKSQRSYLVINGNSCSKPRCVPWIKMVCRLSTLNCNLLDINAITISDRLFLEPSCNFSWKMTMYIVYVTLHSCRTTTTINNIATILVYGLVFSVIIFLSVVTLPLLTQQFTNESELIYPRYYTILITAVNIPSPDIAFIYGLRNYVLPLMIVSSWVLTVSLLKQYISKIGKKKFWLIVNVPLLYQLFAYPLVISDLL